VRHLISFLFTHTVSLECLAISLPTRPHVADQTQDNSTYVCV